MGKLFDFIKDRYQSVKDFEQTLKQNPDARKNYNLYHKPAVDLEYIRDFINFIYNTCNRSPYYDQLKGIENAIWKNDEKYPLPDFNDGVFYEDILNKIEENVLKDNTDLIINKFKREVESVSYGPITHPFEYLINDLKRDLDILNPTLDELPNLDNIKKSLDYANNSLIVKHDGGKLDQVIDTISVSMDASAKEYMPEFAIENGISVDEFKEADRGRRSIRFSFDAHHKFDKFKPALNKKIILSEEYKNKIRALDNYIQSKSILKTPIYGETGKKEYGFLEWFNKASELKDELLNNKNISVDDREKKIESYKRIHKLSFELENITNEYKDILDYFKDNFDLSKIGLPSNIYSGRPFDVNVFELNKYVPNLIEDFDKENAPYGVLLNGYTQLKGYCLDNNLSLDEFLEDPMNAYFRGAQNRINELDNKYIIPRGEMSLGKRMARTLNQEANRYNIANKLGLGYRSLEFLTQAENRDEHLNDNIILTGLAGELSHVLDHSASSLFEPGNYDSINIRKLFAFGEQEDNLIHVADNYKNLAGENYNYDYNMKINSLDNVNPVQECKRVLEIIKDYVIERDYMFKHKSEFIEKGGKFNDEFGPEVIIASAKDYFLDYIVQNNLSIQKIRNDEDRKMIFDFINNPVSVLYKKYQQILPEDKINQINSDYAHEMRKVYGHQCSDFLDSFEENNQKPNGFNTNKTIEQILADNKGSKWELFFKTTSPEYLALKDSILAAIDKKSPSYGDFRLTKFLAKKYLDYKLGQGKQENKLSETGRRRVEFCRSILKAVDELGDGFNEVSVNNSLEDILEPNITRANDASKIIENFQKDVKDDLSEDKSEIIGENDQDNEISIIEKEDIIK